MATLTQLKKNPRETKKKICHTPALKGCPQKRVSCMKLFTRSPKKPNSGVRKLSRVKLGNNSNYVKLLVYIPGERHSIPEHASVLIRGGKTKDLPGIKYKIIRGVLDAKPLVGRVRGRSLFGVKKPRESAV